MVGMRDRARRTRAREFGLCADRVRPVVVDEVNPRAVDEHPADEVLDVLINDRGGDRIRPVVVGEVNRAAIDQRAADGVLRLLVGIRAARRGIRPRGHEVAAHVYHRQDLVLGAERVRQATNHRLEIRPALRGRARHPHGVTIPCRDLARELANRTPIRQMIAH